MAILKLKIKRVGTYANEAPIYGELISKNDYRQINHWKACDSVRHTDKGKTYLYLAVETSIKDHACLGETIYEVLGEKTPPNIEGLNAYDFDEIYNINMGGEGIIYFADEWDKLSNL